AHGFDLAAPRYWNLKLGASLGFGIWNLELLQNEFPRSMVPARRIGHCRPRRVSPDPARGPGADAVQFADVSAANGAESHEAQQARAFVAAAVALPGVAAARDGFRAALFDEGRRV